MKEKGDIVFFDAGSGDAQIEVKLEHETVWLTQDQMAELFQKAKSTINEHIKNIYSEQELDDKITMEKFGNSEFSKKPVYYYNLDVIISVGYRVKSKRGTQFRIWASIRKITPAGEVSTLAGDGTYGYKEGTGAAARFSYPPGVAVDANGNVYVADNDNNRIRKITPAGEVSTLAGAGAEGYNDGPGGIALFDQPGGVAVDSLGNVYVAELISSRIRKITPDGYVYTLAGDGKFGFKEGVGVAAEFAYPTGVVVDGAGNIYVADSGNYAIRKLE